MSDVPMIYNCMIYPRNKTVEPYPATLRGFARIEGLEVGGGPILPPEEVPPVEPPLVIWGGPFDPPPHPEHPIAWPQPPVPPVDPPAQVETPHEGWNWSAQKSGWYYLYVPGQTDPQPKRR